MATVLEIIQGLSQVAANSYDGAKDEDGQIKQTGLQRDKEVSIRDKRVIDGFKIKLHGGNKLCVTYTTEVLIKDLAKKDKYEDLLLQNVADIVSFIKKEFRKVTGSSISLSEIRGQKPSMEMIQTSRIRTEAKITCHYEIGNLEDTSKEKDKQKDKIHKAMEKWLELSTDKRPKNDTRKAEKKD
jgi:hypothetical protein